MEQVKGAMDHRRDNNTDGGNKDDAAHQGIHGGEHLTIIRGYFADGAHTRQDHGGIEQAVDPAVGTGSVVAPNTYTQEKSQNKQTGQDILHHPRTVR